MRLLALILSVIFTVSFPAHAQKTKKPTPKPTPPSEEVYLLVEKPRYWMMARDGDAEGHLLVGSIVRNVSGKQLVVRGYYKVYDADGEPKYNLQQEAVIPPYKQALIRREATIAPVDTKVQVTARYSFTASKPNPVLTAKQVTMQLEWTDDRDLERKHPCVYIHSKLSRDIRASVTFRYYDRNGILLGYDLVPQILLQPEVRQKVVGDSGYHIGERNHQHFTFEVEVAPISIR